MTKKYIEKILTARVYDVAIETPLERARRLTDRLDNLVLLKREDLQQVFSFKLRGAYNKMSKLSQPRDVKDVIDSLGRKSCTGTGTSSSAVKL